MHMLIRYIAIRSSFDRPPRSSPYVLWEVQQHCHRQCWWRFALVDSTHSCWRNWNIASEIPCWHVWAKSSGGLQLVLKEHWVWTLNKSGAVEFSWKHNASNELVESNDIYAFCSERVFVAAWTHPSIPIPPYPTRKAEYHPPATPQRVDGIFVKKWTRQCSNIDQDSQLFFLDATLKVWSPAFLRIRCFPTSWLHSPQQSKRGSFIDLSFLLRSN